MANINTNLFKPWVRKSIPITLISGLNGMYPNAPSEDIFSVYSSSPAKLRENIVSAICKVMSIAYNDDDFGSFGYIQNDNSIDYAVEISQNGSREAAIIKKNSQGIPTIYARTDKGMYQFRENHNNGVLLLTAVLFYEMMCSTDDEFKTNIKLIQAEWKKNITKDNIDEFGKYMTIISENIYRRLCGARNAIKINVLTESGNVNQITNQMLLSGKFIPELKLGKPFVILSDGASSEILEHSEVKVSKSNREWTEEEKRLIPKLPEWYIMPKEVKEVCSLISASTNTFKPKRNFMFRGPSSTGKTSMARAIAAELNMPYMFITCSSDTESSAFLGEPMYDKNGNVKYIESPFITAIKNGYVIEVQEPYVIAKQGVLTSLNGLLDDSAGVTLATGEFVKRHPDCIVIFTTNVSYVGCKKPNQSVLRRMNGVYDINTPSITEICKRVKANTNFDDSSLLKKIVKCAQSIEEFLQDSQIDDGVCGISEIIDWVSTLQIIGDVVEAARSTVVTKATDDPIEQAEILSRIEAEFLGVSYSPSQAVENALNN